MCGEKQEVRVLVRSETGGEQWRLELERAAGSNCHKDIGAVLNVTESHWRVLNKKREPIRNLTRRHHLLHGAEITGTTNRSSETT